MDPDTIRSSNNQKVFRIFLMLLFEFRRVFSQLRPVLKRVRDESRKAITQEEPLPVGFSFRNERQQYVPMPRQNFFDAEDFQRFSDIEHFGNRRRLLQTPASERPRQTRNLSVNIPAVASALKREDLSFSIN